MGIIRIFWSILLFPNSILMLSFVFVKKFPPANVTYILLKPKGGIAPTEKLFLENELLIDKFRGGIRVFPLLYTFKYPAIGNPAF